ncbi:MAG TPA: hypothetical protein VMR28_01015 [Candidatus Saccharimonadales bacterium]|nr:hypothetical protein [Candidatus Saccharimonadales bacterium]
MVNKSIIEINGKQYDAVSGELITQSAHTVAISDGTSSKTKEVVNNAKTGPTLPHHIAPKQVAHIPQPTKTLMRRGVHKPGAATSIPTIRRVQTAAGAMPVSTQTQTKSMQALPNPNRLRRAHDIHKHRLVHHFNKETLSSDQPTSHTPKATPKTITKIQLPPPAAGTSPTQALLDEGLARADSHTQPAVKTRHHRLKHKSKGKSRTTSWLLGK